MVPADLFNLGRVHGGRGKAGDDVDRGANARQDRADQHERNTQPLRGIGDQPRKIGGRLRGAEDQLADARQVEHEVNDADQRAQVQRGHRRFLSAAFPQHAQHEDGRHGRGEGHGNLVDGLEDRAELIALG